MHSKNHRPKTRDELDHLDAVAILPCSVCDAPGPSECHHIRQQSHYTCIALCAECHRGPIMGWHGQKRAWAVRKMDELDALAVTIERLRAIGTIK